MSLVGVNCSCRSGGRIFNVVVVVVCEKNALVVMPGIGVSGPWAHTLMDEMDIDP